MLKGAVRFERKIVLFLESLAQLSYGKNVNRIYKLKCTHAM